MAKNLLKPFVSLSKQAETIDSYESYKELISRLRKMPYEQLYYLFGDVEKALQVLIRGEAKGDNSGICSIVSDIIRLGNVYLKSKDYNDTPVRTEYTFEWIEKEKKKGTYRK